MPRKQIDDYTKFVGIYGAKGLAYIKVNERAAGVEGLQSPIVKNIPLDNINVILDRVGAVDGDIVFFGADKTKVVSEALGALRIKLGHDLNLLTCQWAPLWVVDFPMFEENDDGSLTAMHHPFTSPKCDPQALKANPGAALSRAYDMVLNGTELGGGSIRIHDKKMQQAVFEVLGISAEEQEEKFGFLLDALKFGAPPHGGLAFGLDRLVMLMTGASSIREVIAFPKTQSAADVMTQAPGAVDAKALRELHIACASSPRRNKSYRRRAPRWMPSVSLFSAPRPSPPVPSSSRDWSSLWPVIPSGPTSSIAKNARMPRKARSSPRSSVS